MGRKRYMLVTRPGFLASRRKPNVYDYGERAQDRQGCPRGPGEMNVFITGLNGFIARHLATWLSERGYVVTGTSRSSSERFHAIVWRLGDPIESAPLPVSMWSYMQRTTSGLGQ